MWVMVIDENRIFAEALCEGFGHDDRVAGCGSAFDLDDAVAHLHERSWDVIVVDPGDIGIDAITRLRQVCPEARMVLLTSQPDLGIVADAVRVGVDVILAKTAPLDDLRRAVLAEKILEDGSASLVASMAEEIRRQEADRATGPPVELTPRERDVLALLSRGVLMKDMARTLGISPETCRGYVKSLLMKLDARSQLQAVVIATDRGLLARKADAAT